MELETECSICLLSYTSTNTHRMTSLKCGHCFGFSCILHWIEIEKRPVCPVCSKPCKAGHLREIYAVRKTSRLHMEEEDLIEKYLEEAKKVRDLEKIIAELRNKVDLLQIGSKSLENKKEINDFLLFTTEVLFINTNIALRDNFIEFDTSLNLILVTYVKQHVPGYYKYGMEDEKGEFIPFQSRITDIKSTPYSDGLVLVSSGNEVFLINLSNNRIVYKSEFDNSVTAVSFHPGFQNIIYVGDSTGNVYHINMIINEIKSIMALETRVHSLCATDKYLYAVSVFDIVRLELDSLKFSHNEIFSRKLEGSICIQADTDGLDALFVFRDKESTISCLYIEDDLEQLFYPNVKQDTRVSNRILCGCAYIANHTDNSIRVFNIKTFNLVHTYKFKTRVVNFVVSDIGFVVLTEDGIHWYG
ncbi:E3 ubiquitin-protein ligase RFWD3 [Pancytospora epiphaga]|nr:E3 ubiquitin-protein ligase RFWD3 [Pancytospora epiphaga]